MMIPKSRIIYGGPVEPLTDLSLPMYLLKRLKDGGDKPFAINAENESRRLSYAEVLDQSTRLAEVLRARGVGPGDLVTICSENSIEFVIPVLATFFVGAACAPLSYIYTPREMQHLLRLTAPRVIFLSFSARNALLEALKQATTVKWPLLILMPNSDGSQVQMEGFELLTELLKSKPPNLQFQAYQPKDPDQCVALVLCSSGTTGLPKGVQLLQTNVFSNLTNRQHKRFEIEEERDCFTIGHLPMFHGMGLIIILHSILKNTSIVVMPRFSFETMLRIIQDYKISLLYAAPPLIQQLVVSDLVSQYDLSSLQLIASGISLLYAAPPLIQQLVVSDLVSQYDLSSLQLIASGISLLYAAPPLIQQLVVSDLVSQYDLSSLQLIASGAAPLSAQLQDSVKKKINLKEIRQGYGLTECSLATIVPVNGLNKNGSSGCVFPGLQVKVIDESGRLLGPYERGELCFRGPHVMKGYINDPQATAQAIDKEGWLHTGDVGFYDEDECFFIVDRIKELIKYKGYQVPPAELEGVLQTHPGVADAAVVGVPNVEAGELPLAFVVRKDPALTEKEIIDFVAKNVSPQKRLRGGVKFLGAIPKTPSGKILRRELRKLLQSKM